MNSFNYPVFRIFSLILLSGMILFSAIMPLDLFSQDLTTPLGIRILQNKSFDDSDSSRKVILELYQNLRLTDVLDGMDLIGFQDIGLMDKSIRPLKKKQLRIL